jgi:hypothetical protein
VIDGVELNGAARRDLDASTNPWFIADFGLWMLKVE